MEGGAIQMKAGTSGPGVKAAVGQKVKVSAAVAWNPTTKEIGSGPANGQLAETAEEAIKKHKEAMALKQEV